jgi:prevent-host-death family protein
METVPARDLRNHTADVLRRVTEGAVLTVTVRGEAVAEIRPAEDRRPRFFRRQQLAALVQSDPGLRQHLEELAGDTTDQLDGPT